MALIVVCFLINNLGTISPLLPPCCEAQRDFFLKKLTAIFHSQINNQFFK